VVRNEKEIQTKREEKETKMKNRNRKRPSIARIERRLAAKARMKAMTKKFRGMKVLCM